MLPRDGGNPLTVSPDPAPKTSSDLRFIGETLLRISQALHEHTHKLEQAVEATYAGEGGDPRVKLLADALNVSRSADLELGRVNQATRRVLLTLQEQLNKGGQANTSPGVAAPSDAASSLERERNVLASSIISLERKHSELETLYEIAQTLNSTLQFDEVLRLVMDRVIEVVGAERGFIVLVNPQTTQLEFTIARDKQARTIGEGAFEYNISRSTVDYVVKTRKPKLSENSHDPTKSMMAYDIRSIMCAPLIVRGNCIGAVYVDSRVKANLFTEKDRDLLLGFCNQAAIAIDNARLFSKVNEDKQYMDNIFASIANGLITTDASGMITTFNNAARHILGLDPAKVVGKHFREAFQVLPQVGLVQLLQRAVQEHEHGTLVSYSVDSVIPGRGMVNLELNISSLRDQGTHIGMALVIDDRTEIKRSRAETKQIRDIFGRYVHPNVVQQLIEDPRALNLGGETKEITVIFGDIRGYTRLSESMAPEKVMDLLNGYLEKMVEAIWNQEGTVTSFIGDALMAIFNAPLPQEDHALRAVRAALGMREAVLEYQRNRPQQLQVSFGFGINTGLAVVGNLGSKGHLQNYTAMGDVVNVASRMQGNASDNDILLNRSTFIKVRQYVRVELLPPMSVKNRTEPLEVFRLKGLA